MRSRSILAALIPPLLLTTAASPGGEPSPPSDPIRFFIGTTEGAGWLKKIMSSPQATRVHGRGAVRADGMLVLDQTVEVAGEKTTNRHWLLRRVAPDRFTGTISDAKGPVTAEAMAGRIRIRYTMTAGMAVDQVVVVAPDGRSASNSMKVKRFGITVATVAETIRKQ